MIRKLQLKFVAIFMALVTLVLAGVSVALYSSAHRSLEATSREVLQRVLEDESGYTDGTVMPALPGLGPVQLPYFTVNVTVQRWPSRSYTARVTGGTYQDLDNTDQLTAILSECLAQERSEGFISGYGLRFLRLDTPLYIRIAFVDTSSEQATLGHLMRSYIQIAAAAFLLLLGVSILLARWATAPVARAWRQQRQFLSDASHELKTPLTVILSNAELLGDAHLEGRTARWADNIHSESLRMKKLVEQMLTLARADQEAPTAVLSEVSLSEVAEDCALSFEPVAFEAGKSLEYRIGEDARVSGDAGRLRQVISVLLDNAVKYGDAGGTITLTVDKTDRQARVTVENPGEPIPPQQRKHIFERFYRADASRGEQSGFGLGLPIAAAIAAEHKGTLKADCGPHSNRFVLTLPLRK